MKKLSNEEIQDLLNAQKAQKENSVYNSSYSEYCGDCGNIECTCLYKARKEAIKNGGGTASGFLAFLAFLGFCTFIYLIWESLTR